MKNKISNIKVYINYEQSSCFNRNTSYNHALFIKECIQSIIEQDYKNIELIIIDDGSKDNSVEVIQKMIPICKERF